MYKRIIACFSCLLFAILAGCQPTDTSSVFLDDVIISSKQTLIEATSDESKTTIKDNKNINNNTSNNSNPSGSNITQSTPKTTTESKPKELPEYSTITCRKIGNTEWQSVRIKISETKTTMQLDIPTDWTIKKDKDSIAFLRKDKKIGFITTKDLSKPVEYFKPNNISNDLKEINVDWQIDLINDNGYKFYHTMEVVCVPINQTPPVRIQINYEELDTKSIEILANSIFTVPGDKVSLACNTSNKILILGNSFISTSQIGEFLTDFINTANKNYEVVADSIGNASSTTFSENQHLYNDISTGEYAYILQCGFYNNYNIDGFNVIKTACDLSNTPIFIFPAHNEESSVLLTIKNKLCTVPILDWKGEIDKLLLSGVDYYDLCYRDSIGHSKPLAGYVGAYTIFLNLFNETPPPLSSNAPLSMNYVSSILGENILKIGFEGENLMRIKSPKILCGTYTLD